MEAAPNRRSYVRLAAVRSLYLGMERSMACQIFNRTDRMVRLWIHQFNEGGIDALITKPRSGKPRKVKLQHLEDLLVPVLEDPSQAGELHWTGVKIHGWLQEQLCIELGYRTVIRYLHELDYNLRVPQPWPEGQDEAARQRFVAQLRELQDQPEVELWFCDECGVEGDPRPRRRWSARGSRPKSPYLGEHIRANVIGAICPIDGRCFTMIYNGVDTDVFQHFLDELSTTVPLDAKKRYLIVDNASWHKAARLCWHQFTPLFLPPYSPDFNPIERLWLRLKADYLAGFIAHSSEQLSDSLCTALNSLMNNPDIVSSQCRFRK